jgi:pentatricopeptide repeat protein
MTYLRARKSIKIAPGLKLNLNKKSIGVSVGPRGAHYSINSKGNTTRTAGIPGTGISLVDRQQAHHQAPAPGHPVGPAAAGTGRSVSPYKPDKHAPESEKLFAQVVAALWADNTVAAEQLLTQSVAASQTENEAFGAHVIAGILRWRAGDMNGTISHLEHVLQAHDEARLLYRYGFGPNFQTLFQDGFNVEVADVEATAGMLGQGPINLLLAAYCKAGREDEAVGILQQLITDHDGRLQQNQFPLILLCALYTDLQDWDEIIHLVGALGITNVDDGTLMLRNYQAISMVSNGLNDAALEVLKDCLRSTKRSTAVLNVAHHVRSTIYLQQGKKALALKDLNAIYASNPNFPGVEAQLLALTKTE